MTFDEYIDKMFKQNLEIARDEANHIGDVDCSERTIWNMGVEWTLQDVERYVEHHLEQKWQIKQEAINKVFYD